MPDVGWAVMIARDGEAFGGPLAGLAAGLLALRGLEPSPELVLLVGGDMPTLDPTVMALLVEALAEEPALAAAILEGDPPAVLPMVLRVPEARLAAAGILAGTGRHSLRALLSALPSTIVEAADWRAIDPGGATLRDVDVPGDLA